MDKFAEILSALSALKCNYKVDKDAGLIIVYDIITNSEVLYIKYSLYAGRYFVTWRYNSVDTDNSHKYCNDLLFQSEKDVIDFIISNCQYCIPKFEFNFKSNFFSRYTYTEIFVIPESENRIEIRYGTYYTQCEGYWDLIICYDVTSELYDFILVDVYSNSYQIPEGFITAEFMQRVKSRLAPNGILVMNVIASASFQDKYSQVFDNTFHAVFTHNTSRHVIGWYNPWRISDMANDVSNILYVFYNSENDGRIYTINKTPVIYDRFGK